MGHLHNVYDTDTHFSINPITRAIKNESSKKTTLIQGDHNSERFTFEMPRKIEGHDMMLCNLVELHYTNKDTQTNDVSDDFCEIKDMQVSPDDENVVIFSWLVEDTATQYAGSLEFLVMFKCMADGKCTYKWHTSNNSDITILKGKDNSGVVVERNPNVVDQWREEIFGDAENAVVNINHAEADAVAVVQAEGATQCKAVQAEAEIITASCEQIHRNSMTKAVAIVGNAEGEVIAIDDSANTPFIGLSVYGKSTQGDNPTPDNPQEINSVENPEVDIWTKNLLQNNLSVTTNAGVTYTKNNDGSITINGTATGESYYTFDFENKIPVHEKDLIVSCGNNDNIGVTLVVGYFKKDNTIVNNIASVNKKDATFQYPLEAETTRTFIAVSVGTVCDNLIVYPMIRMAETSADYESYKEKQPLLIPHTLHGIPVSSGGNYTDTDGQEWICDEVDFERGVFVERIAKADLSKGNYTLCERSATFNGVFVTHNENYLNFNPDNALCTIASYRNYVANDNEPIFDLQYNQIRFVPETMEQTVEEFVAKLTSDSIALIALKEPNEIPLTDAEIEAYKALCTNYPNTTILNDSKAFMRVKYGIDTKMYIDRKFEELKQALGGE